MSTDRQTSTIQAKAVGIVKPAFIVASGSALDISKANNRTNEICLDVYNKVIGTSVPAVSEVDKSYKMFKGNFPGFLVL